MPYRKIIFAINEVYHTFNRGIAMQPIFHNYSDYQRALDLINYYRFDNPPFRFSHYNRLAKKEKEIYFNNLKNKDECIVEILAFCLMPNHFHFLLKQKKKEGIPRFMANFQNSYARYFNIKNERNGALVQALFKAVRIEKEEQLLHVSRYIHLNPVTSYIIKIEDLESYPFSSYKMCLYKDDSIINPEYIYESFKTPSSYRKFVLNQVDYQRELAKIRHLIIEV